MTAIEISDSLTHLLSIENSTLRGSSMPHRGGTAQHGLRLNLSGQPYLRTEKSRPKAVFPSSRRSGARRAIPNAIRSRYFQPESDHETERHINGCTVSRMLVAKATNVPMMVQCHLRAPLGSPIDSRRGSWSCFISDQLSETEIDLLARGQKANTKKADKHHHPGRRLGNGAG